MGLRSIVNSAINKAQETFHRVENNAKKVLKGAEKVTANQLGPVVRHISSAVGGDDPVSKVTRGAQNFVKNSVAPVVQEKKGFLGKLIDKGKSLIGGGGNLLRSASDFGGKVLDFGKKALTEIKDRGLDIGRSALNLVTEGIGGFGRSLIEGGGKVLKGIGKTLNPAPLGKLFTGDFKGAWSDLKNNFVSGAKDIGKGVVQGLIQGPVDTFIVGLQNGVSALQTAVGLEPAGRQLNEKEIGELRKVYGDSLDYSQIRLKEGNIGLNNFLAPHTIGNTIYIPKGWLDTNDPNYEQQRNQLLVHESAHSWQYQNGGTDYIGASVWNQLKGVLSGGNRNEAYKFDQPIKDGKSWKELNPEQQAHLIDSAYEKGLFDDPNAKFTLDDGTDVTAYVRDAIDQMRKGKGAA